MARALGNPRCAETFKDQLVDAASQDSKDQVASASFVADVDRRKRGIVEREVSEFHQHGMSAWLEAVRKSCFIAHRREGDLSDWQRSGDRTGVNAVEIPETGHTMCLQTASRQSGWSLSEGRLRLISVVRPWRSNDCCCQSGRTT